MESDELPLFLLQHTPLVAYGMPHHVVKAMMPVRQHFCNIRRQRYLVVEFGNTYGNEGSNIARLTRAMSDSPHNGTRKQDVSRRLPRQRREQCALYTSRASQRVVC